MPSERQESISDMILLAIPVAQKVMKNQKTGDPGSPR
jgi:hypothetical protein